MKTEYSTYTQLGLTPLMLATLAYPLAGRLETVEFLANAGADLNAQSNVSCFTSIHPTLTIHLMLYILIYTGIYILCYNHVFGSHM